MNLTTKEVELLTYIRNKGKTNINEGFIVYKTRKTIVESFKRFTLMGLITNSDIGMFSITKRGKDHLDGLNPRRKKYYTKETGA